MLQIGDLIIYQVHGICRVDDICDQTYVGVTRTYYVLHPIENNHNLTVHIPVEKGKALLMKLIDKEEAEKVLQSFHSEGIEWIQRPQQRGHVYTGIVNTGNRIDIAKVANTLIQKKIELEKDGKKFNELDKKMLTNIEKIFFQEIAVALDTSVEDITDEVNRILDKKIS